MVPDITILFKFDEQDKQLSYKQIPFAAWGELKNVGFTSLTLISAVADWDLDAVAAVVWLERKQRERRLAFADVHRMLSQGEHEFEITDIATEGVGSDGSKVDDGEDPTGDS